MLISKTTWCFDCKTGKMTRFIDPDGKYTTKEAVYQCESCKAEHRIYLEQPPLPYLIHSYHWANGKEIYY